MSSKLAVDVMKQVRIVNPDYIDLKFEDTKPISIPVFGEIVHTLQPNPFESIVINTEQSENDFIKDIIIPLLISANKTCKQKYQSWAICHQIKVYYRSLIKMFSVHLSNNRMFIGGYNYCDCDLGKVTAEDLVNMGFKIYLNDKEIDIKIGKKWKEIDIDSILKLYKKQLSTLEFTSDNRYSVSIYGCKTGFPNFSLIYNPSINRYRIINKSFEDLVPNKYARPIQIATGLMFHLDDKTNMINVWLNCCNYSYNLNIGSISVEDIKQKGIKLKRLVQVNL